MKNCRITIPPLRPLSGLYLSPKDYLIAQEEILLLWIYQALQEFVHSPKNTKLTVRAEGFWIISQSHHKWITAKDLILIYIWETIQLRVVKHDLYDSNYSLVCGLVRESTILISKSCIENYQPEDAVYFKEFLLHKGSRAIGVQDDSYYFSNSLIASRSCENYEKY
jgi:hypothetical protein